MSPRKIGDSATFCKSERRAKRSKRELIPSGPWHHIMMGSGLEGQLHSGPGDHLGQIIDKGQISDGTSRGGRHLAGRSKRI
jgi:hypothetical protein